MVLEEEDILLDKEDARHVRSLSSGMDFGVHAAAEDSGQSLETQQTEEGLRWICQMLTTIGHNDWFLRCIISSAGRL